VVTTGPRPEKGLWVWGNWFFSLSAKKKPRDGGLSAATLHFFSPRRDSRAEEHGGT
jgi:hypothetical protein